MLPVNFRLLIEETNKLWASHALWCTRISVYKQIYRVFKRIGIAIVFSLKYSRSHELYISIIIILLLFKSVHYSISLFFYMKIQNLLDLKLFCYILRKSDFQLSQQREKPD